MGWKGGAPPRCRDGPTAPAPSGKWDGRDRRRCELWCGVQEGQREYEVGRKGREELPHGIETVPQVPHLQGTGMGGTGEDVSCGVGCTAAGGAEGV